MLILASRSPRRSELLRAAGIEFVVRGADVDESVCEGESPFDYVLRLAEVKARAVELHPGEIVLGADTTVAIGGEILAKPADEEDARRMLERLSGRRHEVHTGICMRSLHGGVTTEVCTTGVWFNPLSSAEIEAYVRSGEPADKAGAYAIQGLASKFIPKIDGSYSNVVGLPVDMVYCMLRTHVPE
jgi:septum formation protein